MINEPSIINCVNGYEKIKLKINKRIKRLGH